MNTNLHEQNIRLMASLLKKKKSKTMKLQNNNKEMNYHFHQINTQMLSYLQERFLTSNSFPPFGIDAV